MLYIVPTPIGNLEDMTYRGVQVLKSVDKICCEDTRTSQVLLDHYGIETPKMAYHKFNEEKVQGKILDLLREGKDLAVISDAGMPGIQDPGRRLIQAAIREGLEYTILPGPSAMVTAFIGAGLEAEGFLYYGFLPEKQGKRKKVLENLKTCPYPLIFYEAPHRIYKTLEDMEEVLGKRRVHLGRELTKKFEEYIHMNLGEDLESRVKDRGEFVLIVEGGSQEEKPVDIRKELEDRIRQGMKKSQAVKDVAQSFQIQKNQVYKESLKL